MRTDVSPSLRNSPQFAGVSAGSNADVRSLPLAEVAIASILAAGLWALQTRSWRATELHMKTARFKSTSRASSRGAACAWNRHTTALFAYECQSFLDNVIAGLEQIGAWNDPRISVKFRTIHA